MCTTRDARTKRCVPRRDDVSPNKSLWQFLRGVAAGALLLSAACGGESPAGPTVTPANVPPSNVSPPAPLLPTPPEPTAGEVTTLVVNVVTRPMSSPSTTTYRYTGADAVFHGEAIRDGNAVDVTVRPPGSVIDWRFQFGMPKGQVLQPGNYEEAYLYPVQLASQNGMTLAILGRGCGNTDIPTGRFVVYEAAFGADRRISRFHATFADKCVPSRPDDQYRTGEIRIVGDVAPSGPAEVPLGPPPPPPEPEPPAVYNPAVPNVPTQWAGRFAESTVLGPNRVWAMDVLFKQNNSSITGTVRVPTFGWIGTLKGTLGTDGRVSGTVTFGTGLLFGCATSAPVVFSNFLTTRQTAIRVELEPPCPGLDFNITFELDRTCRLTQLPGPDGGTFVRCDPVYWPSKPSARQTNYQ